MLAADILFNVMALALDAIGLAWLRRLTRRNEAAMAHWSVFAVISGSAAAAAILTKQIFGYRDFATLRFFGMALFWHLPIVLICLSALYRRKLIILPAVLLISLYVYAYHIEPRHLQTTHYVFSSHLLQGLERPIRIAQVSDIQAEDVSAYEKRVLNTLSELKPDLIVYTGDYLHIGDREKYSREAAKLNILFKKMQWSPPFGSYAVLGDSDHPDLWTQVFEDTSVILLSNQTVVIMLPGVQVSLIGLSRNASRSPTDGVLRNAVGGPDGSKFSIYVGHSPDFVRALDEEDAPFLLLAGHTHGGQVQLPFLGPLITLSNLPRKYADYYGPYGKGILSVSRGIGMERYDAPRLRFLCAPEIRMITLQPESAH